MALFKISKGTAANLTTNRPYASEGNAYFTTDDGKFYIDVSGNGSTTTAVVGENRIPLNAAQADKVKSLLKIRFDGGNVTGTSYFPYDGSSEVIVDISPSSIHALRETDNAVSASKWYTARTFTLSDADQTNSATGVSVDGSANVSLLLPSTIKATLTGNADTADAVNHSFIIKVNSGTTENTNQWTFDGSVEKNLNLTPDLLSVLALAGGTMTGSITLPTGSSRINTTGAIMWKVPGGDNSVKSSISSNGNGAIGFATGDDIRFYPSKDSTNGSTQGIRLYKSNDIYTIGLFADNSTTAVTGNLGTPNRPWANVYASNFVGHASSAGYMVSLGDRHLDYTGLDDSMTLTSAPLTSIDGAFPAYSDANAILTIDKLGSPSGVDDDYKYISQLAFSSNGKLYYRSFNNMNINTTSDWAEIAFVGGTIAVADHVGHSLTIGSYVYDGSAAVTIPVYAGAIS